MKVKSVFVKSPFDYELRSVELPALKADEALQRPRPRREGIRILKGTRIYHEGKKRFCKKPV